MKPPILVTGAQGFIGRYTVAECARRWPGRRIVGIGRSDAVDTFTHSVTVAGESVPAPLPPELSWRHDGSIDYVSVDIRCRVGLEALLRDVRPSLVLHLASGLRDDLPSHLFPTNVEGTIALLEAIAETAVPVERIVLGSSGSVYGDAARTTLPLAESTRCEPADLYAVSKLASEQAARVVARSSGLPVVAARIFNVVGAGQEERHVVGRFASQLASIVTGKQPAKLALGDLSPTRDFIDVRDVATALVDIAERACEPAYNVASGEETSIATILELLLEIAGLTGRVERISTYARPADLPRYVADMRKTRKLGFACRVTLQESLAAVFGYYAQMLAALA